MVTPCQAARTAVLAVVFGLVTALALPAGAQAPGRLTVFAAASLAGLMEDVGAAGGVEEGVELRLVHASSGQLARQILAGAEADAFISADARWTDELAAVDGLVAGPARALFANELVLVAPAGSDTAFEPVRGADLAALLGTGHLAMGDPDHVPAGAYGRSALVWLGAWQALEPRIARADDVRQALAWVARGEAPLGIVYLSDALAEPAVRVVATLPAESHQPIVYTGVAIAGGDAARAERLFDVISSPAGARILRQHGFRPITREPSTPS